MYRIIKIDGTELGITDNPVYIKYGESGSFAPTSVENAIGVAYLGEPYNLVGHSEINGADTVVVSAIDGGAEVHSIASTINILLGVTE